MLFDISDLYEIGMSAAGMALSLIAESTDSNEFQEVVSFLNSWVFGNVTSELSADIEELCEEILAEVQELNQNLTAYSSEIERLLGEQNYKILYDDLEDSWDTSVMLADKVYSTSVDRALKDYMAYMEAADAYADVYGSGQDTTSEEVDFNAAKEDFQESLYEVYAFKNDSSSIAKSEEEKRYELFTEDGVDIVILDFISSMSSEDNLEAYANAAAQYAYAAVPFSGDQYDIIINNISNQYMRIVEMELMYNEFLAMRAEYFNSEECSASIEKYMSAADKRKYINESGSVLQALKNGYKNRMDKFNECNAEAANNMNDALDNELIISLSGAGNLTMKLEDYVQNDGDNIVTLTNTAFMSTFDSYDVEADLGNIDYGWATVMTQDTVDHFSSSAKITSEQMKFIKVAIPTGRGCKIYYILDPTQFETTDGVMSDSLYFYNLTSKVDCSAAYDYHVPSCDFYNYTRGVYSDGTNTYTCVTSASDFWTLFDSPTLSYYSNQTSDYLRSYLPGLAAYEKYVASSASSAQYTYFILPDYYTSADFFETAYTDFITVSATQQVASSTDFKEGTINSENRQSGKKNGETTYSLILEAADETTASSESIGYVVSVNENLANRLLYTDAGGTERSGLKVASKLYVPGDTVTFTVSDKVANRFSGLYLVYTENGVEKKEEIQLTAISGGWQGSFVMPAANVTLHGKWILTADDTETVGDEESLNDTQESSQTSQEVKTVKSAETGCADFLWLWMALALCGGTAVFAETMRVKKFYRK